MNQQPDKFFRGKLQGFQKTAPADAWQRISQNVRKKDFRAVWLRVAAAVLLLVTGTLLIYPAFQNNEEQLVAETTRVRKTEPTAVPDPTAKEVERKAETTITDPAASHSKDQALQAEDRKLRARKPRQTLIPTAQVEQTVEPLPALEPGLTAKAIDVDHTADRPVEKEVLDQPRTVTIVFTAEEVNEKYLVKNTDGEATAKEKESSGLRKLLDKAYDLKHNQDPIGDLRQKKNEILAMNFRNDKRTQND